ncbi:MAG: 3-dehydroquinate synthase [Cyanobacteriota bacterium]|nr:3-dehydroquinate synthase [Cyanobacteriota bacterium]
MAAHPSTIPVAPAERVVQVALPHDPYPIVIGGGVLARLGRWVTTHAVRPGSKVLVVSNPVVHEHYGQRAEQSLREAGLEVSRLVLEAGEEQKTLATVSRIHDAAYEQRLERGSLLVALGGGVVGDMVGFAAATWLRGIAVVQVPTTLLAMVDAAIGGKTGVNHPGGKNLIGAFHQPKVVLIDPEVLATLPEREFRAGMAEVIKYGVIGDAALFEGLEGQAALAPRQGLASLAAIGPTLLTELLERSAAAKAKVVAADEREGGLRAVLNYGHTLGHAIETLTGYGTYLHGEAVGLGMLMAGTIARRMALWDADAEGRQRALVEAAGLPLCLAASLDPDAVLSTLRRDKKVVGGLVRFVLPSAIGRVVVRDDVDEGMILEALRLHSGPL